VAKGRITALGDPEALHAYAYLPDMARAAVGLIDHASALPAFADIPFAGHAFSVRDLATRVARLSGRPMQVVQYPVWIFTFLGPFWELAREFREMLYLNSHPHSLDPAPLRRWLPDHQDTPLDQVIAAHLAALGRQGSATSTQTG